MKVFNTNETGVLTVIEVYVLSLQAVIANDLRELDLGYDIDSLEKCLECLVKSMQDTQSVNSLNNPNVRGPYYVNNKPLN